MNILNDKELVGKTPLVTVLLLEWANIGQIYRMWTEHSALGQSLMSWVSVNIALWLWLNFYRVITPENKSAKIATGIGIILNSFVIFSVAYFRYGGK